MFDENTPIPYGPLQGQKLNEIDDRMSLRHWLALAPNLCKTESDMEILNFIGKHVDGEDWISYKMKAVLSDVYVAPFGKFKGMPLSKIPRNELDSYLKYLENNPTKDALGKEYLAKGRAYLAVNLN